MDILKDFIDINKDTIKKTFKSLSKNWMIIFTGMIYTLLSIFVYRVLSTLFIGPTSIIGGLLNTVFNMSLISNYLYLLYNVIVYDRISLQDFKEGFTALIGKVYGVFFIAWLGGYVLSIAFGLLRSSAYLLYNIVTISILVLMNALPETIYLKDRSPGDSIYYAFEFIKENWINWIIPNAILYFILYLISGELITNLFRTQISFSFRFNPLGIGTYILGQLIFSFIMIYRGHLFKLLSESSRRKRMFQNKYYK